jgi:hypothetical protein
MHDLPSGPRLLALARAVLSEELMPLLPQDRQEEARRVIAAMAIAEREAAAGEEAFQEILDELAAFYGIASPSPKPPPRNAGGLRSGRVRGDPTGLLWRFADDLRRGAFTAAPARERAARALLWRLTVAKLRRANPRFLAANGFA